MTQLYSRVFIQILDSSLAIDWQARHVFEDLLKLTDDGVVDMTREALCRRTNVPPDVLDKALAVLEAPDPKSRNPAEEGRRIMRLDEHRNWGWRIVNWDEYEAIRSKEDQRQQTAARVRKFRAKHPPAPPETGTEVPPTPEHALQNRYGALHGVTLPVRLDTQTFRNAWFEEWIPYRLSVKKVKKPEMLFTAQLRYLEPFGPEKAVEMLRQSIRNGWQGVFELKQSAQNAGGAATIVHQKELERVEVCMSTLRNSYDAHQAWTDKDRDKMKMLKDRREELRKALGVKV